MATFQKIISEDSNGVVSVSSKLGVGTSSPIQAVDIRGQLQLDNWIRGWQSPSTHTYGRYWMNFNSGNPVYRTSHDNNYHKFQRYSDEDVMIVGGANKRVGIGASSPRGRLDVLGTSGTQGFYVSDYGGAVYLPTDIVHSSGAGTFDIQVRNYRLGTSTGGDISIYPRYGTNSLGLGTSSYQNQFFINGVNGNIGIGTTSPSTKFHVSSGAIRLDSSQQLQFGGSSTHIDGDSGYIAIDVNSAERMRINSSGQVGIGTSSPTHPLHVDGNLFLGRISANSTNSILFHPGSGGAYPYMDVDSAGRFDIKIDGTNAMSFSENGGGIGIGTTSPSEALHIDGNIKVEGGDTYYDVYKGPRTTGEYMYLTTTRGISFIDHGAGTMGIYDGSHRKIYLGTSNYHMNTWSYGDINLPLDDNNTSHKIKITGSSTSEIYAQNYDVYWSTSLNHVLVSRDGFYHRSSDSSKIINFRHDVNSVHQIDTNMNDFKILAGSHTGGFGFRTSGNTGTHLAIQPIYTDNNTSGMKFNTKASGTDTERMRITSAGKVGIGTTDPNTILHLQDSIPSITITDTDDGGDARISGNGGHLSLEADYNNEVAGSRIDFDVDGTQRMRLDSSGRLMIGTTTASGTLTVDPDENSAITLGKAKFYSAVTDYMYLSHFDYATSSNYAVKQAPTGSTTINAPSGQTVKLGINNSGKLTVDATGKVGIGTSSPGQTLHVDGNIRVGDSADYIFSNIFAGLSPALVKIQSSPSNDIAFNAGGAETVRFTSDGKVGIGTNSPNNIFNVRDSANSLDLFSIRSTGSETRIGIGKNSADCAIDFSTSLPNGGGTIQNAFRMNYINNVRTGSHNGRLVLQSNNGIRIAGYNDNPSGNYYGLEVKNTRDGTADKVLNVMKYDDTSLMTVKSNGLVGINTDSPSQKLDIQGNSSSGTIVQIRDTGGEYPVGITYNRSVSGNHYAWYLGTKYENSTDEGYNGRRFTLGVKISNGYSADLTNDTTSLMWWNQTDKSATHKGPVDIRKSGSNARHADTALMITNTNASSMTAQMEIMSGNAGYSNLYLGDTNSYSQGGLSYDHTNDNFNFRASNSIKMTLNSGGLSVTPDVDTTHTFGRIRLHSVSSDYATFSHYDQDGGSEYALRQSAGGATNVNARTGQKVNLAIANSHKVTLSGDNLGIGNSSPLYKLDLDTGGRINRASNDPYLILARDNTSVAQIRGVSGGGINITDGGSGGTNSTSRIYVDNSGNVGIGDITPSKKLDVGGSFQVQGTADFQDTVVFEGDVDLTNASIEGLPVVTASPTTIFKCATTATNINYGVSLTKGDILFGTPTTENGTYISHTNNDEKITLKRAGEYEISVTLVVTAQSASNRFTCLTYVEHYNSSNTLLDSYGLEAMYIRSNGANYNSGAMAGQIRIITSSLNTWVKVTSMVLDRESTGTVPLNTTYSKIRIDKIDYNQ